jgi:ATP-dependent DNA helicase RecG
MRAACNEIGQSQVHAEQNRNRRIGEFLKELDLTEGRLTGIPKILKAMAANGSPAPLFETDDERLWFGCRRSRRPRM